MAGGSDFKPEKTACPICHMRFANLIRHLKRNARCRASLARRFPGPILAGTAEDFLRGG